MFFIYFLTSLTKSEIPHSLPERREPESVSVQYFKSFEASRKTYFSDKIFGIKINKDVDGIEGIVNELLKPYKEINYTALILGMFQQMYGENSDYKRSN